MSGEHLIELEGITKTFGTGAAAFQALRGVDLTIDRGDFVAVMGPSGSGKSTTMNILGCLDVPSGGVFRFMGTEVQALSQDQRSLLRRRYLGFVFQGFNLLARTTAVENVELPLLYRGEKRAARRAAAMRALDRVGLAPWADHTPAELSGGQQQRVAIARALVTDPEVLLADEPTGNLDSERSVEIMRFLAELNQQGITILMVTHEPEMAAFAKTIVHFRDGVVDRIEAGALAGEPGLMVGMFGTTLLLAFREIRRHILRSFLTTLGIIIGVAAVITMVTLGRGVTQDIEEQINSLGSNVFFVFPIEGERGQIRAFDETDVRAVREQVAGVKFVAGQVERTVVAIYNGQDWDSRIEGVNNEFFDARGVKIAEGRRFTQAEMDAGANVCIVGPTVTEELFVPGESPVGERMRLNDVSCQVVGVFSTRGTVGGAGDEDNSVFVPLTNAQRRFTGNTDIGYMAVAYDAAYDSSAMTAALVSLLRERRVLLDGQANDFDIIDTAQINETVQDTVGTMTVMVAAIAAISLVVGGVGIMNIMLVSVTERTREIGIRLAIGALAREVRMQFLTEAVVLCCFGGLVGIVLGFALSWSLAGALGFPFVFDPGINVLSFVISALIGILFGYFPARRASKLDPIEALRHE